MVKLRKGEVGKTIRINFAIDLSSNTEISMVFRKPDNSEVIKSSADGVTVGAGVTDATLGALAANQYLEYEVEANLLDTAGWWDIHGIYTNTAEDPDDIFKTERVRFEVAL